jgi:hypothetical protein
VEDKKNELARWAIERLVQETFMYVQMLNNITQRYPELVIPIARKQVVWPGLISRKRAFQQDNAKLIDKIQLGKESGYSDREWQPDAPATHGAHWVHWWGSGMAKKWRLPEITRKNKKSWFDKTWRCMERDLHIELENDPLLGPLGKSAKKFYYKREDPKKRMPLAVRAEIKRQIWKAFDTLIFPSK